MSVQVRGQFAPANDLQSQLNDMLDDTASDTSSLQASPAPRLLPAASAPTRPSGNPQGSPFDTAPQQRPATPGSLGNGPSLQRILPASDDIDLQQLQMQAAGRGAGQQAQVVELKNQLQVPNCWLWHISAVCRIF